MSARQPLGLILDMPAETYHTINAMSAGGLRRMAKSPAHFFGKQLDPARPEGGTSEAMRAGTLAHLALLEPHLIPKLCAVQPPGLDGRTRDGKAWKEANSGKMSITAEALATAEAQARAARALPEVGALLSNGYAESSAFWIDEQTGELCKCRPDWTSPAGDGVVLLDLKTCQDASPSGFAKAIASMGYDLQAAWYTDGFTAATGKQVHGFVFVGVESEWPHVAAPYMLDDEDIEGARRVNRRLLNLYAECRRQSSWPGYQASIQPITLPRWAKRETA
jgi:hypothetical protein